MKIYCIDDIQNNPVVLSAIFSKLIPEAQIIHARVRHGRY